MSGNETIAALLAIWDEALSGEHWAELRRALRQLVDQFQQSADDEARAEITIRITDLLRGADPDLYRQLIAMRKAIRAGTAQNRFGTRGMPSGEALATVWQEIRAHEGTTRGEPISTGDTGGTALTLGGGAEATDVAREPRYTRYTDICCPQRAQLNERIAVTVGLTLEPSPHTLVAQPLDLGPEPVQVRLTAPRMALLGPGEQSVPILPDADSPPVVFYLLPQALGPAEVTLEFRQQGQFVAPPVTFRVEVVAHEVAYAAAPYPPTAVDPALARAVKAPDLTLRVYYDPGASRLLFALWREGVVIHEEPAEAFAGAGPAAYIEGLYRDLALLRQGRDSVRVGGRGGRMLSGEDIARTLQRIGNRLWEKLIPPGLRLVYARERGAWSDADERLSMLLISDEPGIPWELVRPFDEEGAWEESFWCETFHFARWLPRHPDLNRQFAPSPRLTTAQVAVLAPECYSELGAIAVERQLLRDLAARHGLCDRSPARATAAAVADLLEAGGYDWMHAVSHGDFLPENASNCSVLWLEDRLSLSSEVITGAAITRHLGRQRPAFVFNACHLAREGPALSGLDGWATQLVGRGAGLFLAPTWTVTDELAAGFARTFYEHFFDRGQSAAAAVWAARQAIKRPGDPTWLAYSLYAHPNVCVTVTAAGA